MSWHLKDRELEKNLIKVDPEFLSKLNTACETLDTNKDGDFYKYQTCFVKLNHYGKIIGELFLTRDDIEYKTTYNPHAWNNYPEVTPPYGLMMRIKMKNEYLRAGYLKKLHDGDSWVNPNGVLMWNAENAEVEFFRPWED